MAEALPASFGRDLHLLKARWRVAIVRGIFYDMVRNMRRDQ